MLIRHSSKVSSHEIKPGTDFYPTANQRFRLVKPLLGTIATAWSSIHAKSGLSQIQAN